MYSRIIVLKFGGSVLCTTGDVHRVAQEIYRWRRIGYRVIAVVSAIGDTTDELSQQVDKFGQAIDPQKAALLLSTGELQSASLVGLALDRAGVSSFVCDDTSIGLESSGSDLDARLVSVETRWLDSKLAERGVVVLPGFIGRNPAGHLQLLGRGGSDLTALFIADSLNATKCRLVKDVDGLYEYDPRLAEDSLHPRRFQLVTFEDALRLDESIVQHKAIRFALDANRSFEVASISSHYSTQVGRFSCSSFVTEDRTASSNDRPHVGSSASQKIALLGLGTVGLGVYRYVNEFLGGQFEFSAIAVRDHQKAIDNGVPEHLLSCDPRAAIDSNCEIVVELVGGLEFPVKWIERALRCGRHVVTANKSLLALDGKRLQQLAEGNQVRLLHSAAVGGATPMLELLKQIASGDNIRCVTGIVNGTVNYVLDQWCNGRAFDDAVFSAQKHGLAEQNPYRDFSGIDAAEKLVLIARELGIELRVNEIERDELDAASLGQARGSIIRQLARISIDRESIPLRVAASIKLVSVSSDSVFSRVRGAGNVIEVESERLGRQVIEGIGAGRWPTTSAVVANLLELSTVGTSATPLNYRRSSVCV